MKKWARNTVAIALCAALCLGGVCVAVAENSTGAAKNAEPAIPQESTQTDEAQAVTKDETVYVLAASDGSVEKIIVSDWLKNQLGSGTIADQSDLRAIENVKGEEAFSSDGTATLWAADGNDIYYQGVAQKELPVKLSVSYQLDGRSISAKELAGQSGRVTIRFDYENCQYELAEIEGQQEKIYVPFAVLTGTLLDNDIFRNVEVTNGRVINDGDRTIVVGLALPGLQQNLNLDRDKLDIPDYVEITADAENFELGMTATIATNRLFSEIDREKLDDTDDLADSMTELTDAMDQLLDGSGELYDGLCTLLEESDELVDGVDELTRGARRLKSGAAELNSGAADLNNGLKTLSGNSSTLNAGAKQVFESLLSTATAQLKAAGVEVPTLTIENYANVLEGIIGSMDSDAVYAQAKAQVTAAVEAQRPAITQQVTAAVQQTVEETVTAAVRETVEEAVTEAVEAQVTEQVLAQSGLSRAEYEAADDDTRAQIEAAIAQQMASAEVEATISEQVTAQMADADTGAAISAEVEAQMASDEIAATIAQNVESAIARAVEEQMQSDAVQSQLAAAGAGAKTIIDLKTSLDSYNTFYSGLSAYTKGVDDAAKGAAELKAGATKLKTGTAELYDGALTMKESMPDLIDGITELRDGGKELADGLAEFNEEGIQKLVDLIDDDLEGVAARLKATVDASKGYRNFAGIGDGMEGQVKFIYRTDEIKAN